MKIFCGEKDINYNRSDGYAFLNWRFDNLMGSNNKDNPFQIVKDNCEMGKAYIASAIITLYSIEYNGNLYNEADALIFPVLFNIWHGIELWLKSSIVAINLLKDNTAETLKQHHDLYEYVYILKDEMYKFGLNHTAEIALTDLEIMIREFKRVNARFDFARYSFNNHGDYQFYNAPYGDDNQWQKNPPIDLIQTVPNTCVKLDLLFETVLKIVESFGGFVNFLTLLISEDESLTDDAYDMYLETIHSFEKKLDNKTDEDIDPIKQMMRLIFMNIL